MFDANEPTEIKTEFTGAAQDDDVAFFAALRAAVETHELVTNEPTQRRCGLESYVFFTY
jgi:hypothetical protein